MNTVRKILFIGPLPPPTDGQSKASEQVLLALREYRNEVKVVNLNRSSLSRSFKSQIRRAFEILPMLIQVLIKRKRVNAIYISLSESLLGNLKDIFIYILLIGKLNRITIHMLGGSGMNIILNQKSIMSMINGFFMSRMRGVIVEGERGYEVFAKYFTIDRITIIPNFVDDFLFAKDVEIRRKFKRIEKINVLYLSNMLDGKGYLDLFSGFSMLSSEDKSRICLSYVGGFPEKYFKDRFLDLIAGESNVEYLGGFIDGEAKRILYLDSHIFCLPTYYPYEGQPISILEAYATGCVVLTTLHGGIPDIFIDKKNGYLVKEKNPESIKIVLQNILQNKEDLESIALGNADEASLKFRSEQFRQRIASEFEW